MYVDWYKCKGGIWCDLYKLDLGHKYLKKSSGVFILWTDAEERSVIKIGHGDVAKELIKLKADMSIKAFEHLSLHVAWADVSFMKRKSIAAYLENNTNPKITTSGFGSSETKVNLPWE